MQMSKSPIISGYEIFSHAPVVINSFLNKIVTIQHANQSIIILTQCALHQLVHTLTGCNVMYFKIFLECFILTNETKIPLNGLVLGACYNTCLWHNWNLFSTCKRIILYHVKLKLFTTVIAIENIQVNKTAVFSKQIR
jgi:hypothetical protein